MTRMSNAERQKRYRERKKAKEGYSFLKKEVQRVKKYYVPTSELTSRSLSKRRKRIKESMRRHRQRANENTQQNQIEPGTEPNTNNIQSETQSNNEPGPCDSTTGSQQSTSSTIGQQLVVKMDFNQNSHGMKRKRRKNKSLSRANKK